MKNASLRHQSSILDLSEALLVTTLNRIALFDAEGWKCGVLGFAGTKKMGR
jgi:hypothetical protein